MNENELDIQQSDDERKMAVRQQLSNVEMQIANSDLPIDLSQATKIPFDQMPALGVGLSSLSTAFRSITTTLDVPTLLQATDKAGNSIDIATLQRFKDGSGLMGSTRNAVKGFEQVRLHAVDGGTISTVTSMPYDPTGLFMAAALAQLNQKLDSIQETVDEMFEYMQEKDKAILRGNVLALQHYLNEYHFNWDNATWMGNAHKETLEIKRESEQQIIHLRAQIRKKLKGKAAIEVRALMDKKMNEVLDRLKEYQLGIYTYSFASFLEPMLSENYDKQYLDAIASSIVEHGNDYRFLYTECYNAIEASAEGAVDSLLLHGTAKALSGLGSLVEKTPIGERTLLDETIEGAGDAVSDFNKSQSGKLMKKLLHAKTPDVLPFRDAVESVNMLYNQPQQLLADKDALYVLPAAAVSGE